MEIGKYFRMSREIYPRIDITTTTEALSKDLEEARGRLSVLTAMLDRRSIDKHYADALKGVCGGGLLGLSLMMAAGLLTAILLTILVYADSHAWIYLTKKQVFFYFTFLSAKSTLRLFYITKCFECLS